MAERATGGPPLISPYDELARQIGEAAYKVTDEQVAKVVERTGSEKAAFELMMATALGAGLHLQVHDESRGTCSLAFVVLLAGLFHSTW